MDGKNNHETSGLLRTHHCGEIRPSHLGQEVIVSGWVNKYRNLGGLHFIDVRDKHGLTQLNFENYSDKTVLKEAALESVIYAKGIVGKRPESALNKNMLTGEVEVMVSEFKVLSRCDIDKLPFLPHGQIEATEDLRLKYRYLDLRGHKLQEILKLRSLVCQKVRNTLAGLDHVEVETPVLYKSTPEGARDYIVPSRVNPNKVYALPQSPQTLKQLLMIAGTDRYFQITKCFRDEDLRADRQPEFTQIDIEASFIKARYIKNLSETLIKNLFPVPKDFILPEMSYHEAMDKYGTDRPDVRFGLTHIDVTALFKGSDFTIFSDVEKQGGLIKAFFIKKSEGSLTRKDTDHLNEIVKPLGGKGVAFFKIEGGSLSGGISKFITPDLLVKLNNLSGLNEDGMYLFFADKNHALAHQYADTIRRHLGTHLNLKGDELRFLWVYDFPLLQWDEEEKRFMAIHHPFTSPKVEEIELFLKADMIKDQKVLANLKSESYDVVCNGSEIGGGSIRIHDQFVQNKMFEVLGMSEAEIKHQFGFFIEALMYGTPPHGGIAFGLDRIVMILAKTDSIRDVIAFPKTSSGSDLMASAPSAPSEAQLRELHMSWLK